ncbi:MAG: type ISP restriction/modification enzyme [Aggregatilineales bacterium]
MLSTATQQQAIRAYLGQIESVQQRGNATEHSYRPAMKALLDSFAPNAQVTNEPKRIKCGAPDFVVARQIGGQWLNVAYVEAKDVGVNLAEIETTDQLQRYRGALPNLILTDQLEFRAYVAGNLRQTVRIGHFNAHGKLEAEPDSMETLAALLDQCLNASPESIATARDLAGRLAKLAHLIRDLMIEAFKNNEVTPMIADLRSALAETLLPHFKDADSTPDFADMFAQLLTYALFAARANHPAGQVFTRQTAAAGIPKTNPFLRQLFPMITGVDLDREAFAGFVDDLVALLNYADMDKILAEFGRREGFDDPIVHFYETFLTAYNPQLRELRGVYYTPQPVISYVTRSVDQILREQFDCRDGLADRSKMPTESGTEQHKVLILDPAAGTGAFLYQIVDFIRERYRARGDAGLWPGYVRDHLLPRLFGFELLVAPYAVAHLKLGMQLAALDLPPAERPTWAYDFKRDERLNVYLTNTLDEAEHEIHTLWGPLRVIAEEAKAASKIKRDLPIMVIVGNPPYSGHSANQGKWITDLLHGRIPGQPGYFEVDGQPLNERNPKWLNDDYVKFIRFAQWRIEQTGQGVLAFITNHGYLENPTFRGMRQQLMRAFDDIYVLDLHGNARKHERAPDGSADENVFDIQQGVAIALFIKRPTTPGGMAAGVSPGIKTLRLTAPPPEGGDSERLQPISGDSDGVSGTIHYEGSSAHRQQPPLGGSDDSRMALASGDTISRITPPGDAHPATIHHAELFGTREHKYDWLRSHDFATMPWQAVNPTTPQYLFVPRAADDEAEYNAGWSVRDILPVNVLGFQTHRDDFAIAYDAATMRQRIQDMRDTRLSDSELREKYAIRDSQEWHVADVRAQLRADSHWTDALIDCMYRPFDRRPCYFSDMTMDRPRRELLNHVVGKYNLCLLVSRQQATTGFRHCWIADIPANDCVVSTTSHEANQVFPLYLYPEAGRLLDAPPYPPGKNGRVPNLAPKFVAELAACVGLTFVADGRGDLQTTFGPEDALHYLYAALHSPTYRERFAPFLKTDFPRIPLPDDRAEFVRLCAIGAQLAALHLLDPAREWSDAARFPVKGDNRVETGYPKHDADRVYLNKTQYFAGVSDAVWTFQVGGYQVADKWLKDRRGRELSGDELEQYGRIVNALAETIRLMGEIDGGG